MKRRAERVGSSASKMPAQMFDKMWGRRPMSNGPKGCIRSPGQGGSTGASQPKEAIAGTTARDCSSTVVVCAACENHQTPDLPKQSRYRNPGFTIGAFAVGPLVLTGRAIPEGARCIRPFRAQGQPFKELRDANSDM